MRTAAVFCERLGTLNLTNPRPNVAVDIIDARASRFSVGQQSNGPFELSTRFLAEPSLIGRIK